MLASVFGQDEQFLDKKGRVVLPESGDWALGFNAVPIFTFIGNTFNGSTSNNHMGNDKFAGFTENTILGKYFLSDKKAIRVNFRFGVHNKNVTNDIVNDFLNNPDSLVLDRAKFKTSNFNLGLGHEWRLGKGRLQGVVGGEVFFQYTSSVKSQFEYGNAFAAGNVTPLTTLWDPSGFAITANSVGERILSSKGGGKCGFGARLFAGVEYFVAPKISLGAEFGWYLGYSQQSKSTVTYERWSTLDNASYEVTREKSGNKYFDADTDNFGGGIYLIFHFQ